MHRLIVTNTLPEDLQRFHMRLADVEECRLSSGLSPEEAVKQSIMASKFTWSITDRQTKKVVAIYGLSEAQEDTRIGIPWSLYGVGINRVAKSVTGVLKAYSDRLLKEYLLFHNIVYSGNTSAIRWLGLLGYTVNTSEAIDHNGEKFYHFYKVNIEKLKEGTLYV